MATHAATRNISGLARALAQNGLMSEYEAEALQTQAQQANISFVEQVLLGKRMTPQQLAVFASRAFGTPLLDLNSFDFDQINKDLVDLKIAQARRVLPLYKRSNKLFVAISDPANLQALDEVRFKTNLVPEPIVVEDDKLGQAIARLVEASGATLKDMANLEDMEVALEEGSAVISIEDDSDVEDAPVVKYIQKLLTDAIASGASDIHFEPYERFYRVRYRIDGILMEIAQPPIAIKDKVASRIKVISKLDISEKRVPQDGRMKIVLSKSKTIDFCVSTLPTLYGEKIVMRILDSAGVKLGIEALGYDPDQQESLMFAIGRPYGMILVTGPTGSGKTVSLYTCLNILNQPGVNIATAEDPCEIQLPGVNQVNVNDKAGLTFAAALKAFLRQDPDIIMVGEIRDLETADIAIKAAQTGHLVLSTLHTNDAPTTLTRLLNMGVAPFNVASSVIMITAQRLGRRLCKCKKPEDIPPEALLRAGFTE
jgi:type IV pilus assembly protein PilB